MSLCHYVALETRFSLDLGYFVSVVRKMAKKRWLQGYEVGSLGLWKVGQ